MSILTSLSPPTPSHTCNPLISTLNYFAWLPIQTWDKAQESTISFLHIPSLHYSSLLPIIIQSFLCVSKNLSHQENQLVDRCLILLRLIFHIWGQKKCKSLISLIFHLPLPYPIFNEDGTNAGCYFLTYFSNLFLLCGSTTSNVQTQPGTFCSELLSLIVKHWGWQVLQRICITCWYCSYRYFPYCTGRRGCGRCFLQNWGRLGWRDIVMLTALSSWRTRDDCSIQSMLRWGFEETFAEQN